MEGGLRSVDLKLLRGVCSRLFGGPLAITTWSSRRLACALLGVVGAVQVDEYASGWAVVALSSLGLGIKGAVENLTVPDLHGLTITIDSAAIVRHSAEQERTIGSRFPCDSRRKGKREYSTLTMSALTPPVLFLLSPVSLQVQEQPVQPQPIGNLRFVVTII